MNKTVNMRQADVYLMMRAIFCWLVWVGASDLKAPELSYDCDGVSVRPIVRINK